MTEKSLYERDERLWLLEQIEALKLQRMDLLDATHLLEHLESCVMLQESELQFDLMGICWRLIRLECSDLTLDEIREHKNKILIHRVTARRHLEETPSIREFVDAILPRVWTDSLRIADIGGPYASTMQSYCVEQIIDFDWHPTFYSRPAQQIS